MPTLKIQKFLHSCLLITFNNTKLLIDPGALSFTNTNLMPQDLSPVDIILLTHEHFDHFYPEALKILTANKTATIYTHHHLHNLLKEQGIPSTVIEPGKTITHGPFTIQALDAPHGALPILAPPHLAFLINNVILHPGDSLAFNQKCRVLALPIAGPWMTLLQAVDKAKEIRPEIIIPIHDLIITDIMRERVYTMCTKVLGEAQLPFHPLNMGENISLSF